MTTPHGKMCYMPVKVEPTAHQKRCLQVEGHEGKDPDEQLNPKKKVWEKLAVDLKTSGCDKCLAQWQGSNLLAPNGGQVKAKSLKGAPIK